MFINKFSKFPKRFTEAFLHKESFCFMRPVSNQFSSQSKKAGASTKIAARTFTNHLEYVNPWELMSWQR